jgi:hypothetical protein
MFKEKKLSKPRTIIAAQKWVSLNERLHESDERIKKAGFGL